FRCSGLADIICSSGIIFVYVPFKKLYVRIINAYRLANAIKLSISHMMSTFPFFTHYMIMSVTVAEDLIIGIGCNHLANKQIMHLLVMRPGNQLAEYLCSTALPREISKPENLNTLWPDGANFSGTSRRLSLPSR